VDLIEPQPERLHAADGEQNREHQRERQQPSQQHRAGLVAQEQRHQGGLVGRGHEARGEHQQPDRRVQRHAASRRQPVQLRHPAQVPGDGEQRHDHGRDEHGAVPPARSGARSRWRQQQHAQQQEAGTAERGRTAGKDRHELRDLVAEEQRVDPEVDPQDVLGQERRRQRGGERGGGLTQARGVDAEREQGGAGEHEQHGVERLGQRQEHGRGRQRHDPEHVCLQQERAQSHGDGPGHDRNSADS
jgi:hypothetical protein